MQPADAREERLEAIRIEGHDLRSPFANIRSYAAMLLSRRSEPVDPKTKRAAEVIARNADRGLQLIDDLIDLERAELGGLLLEISPDSIATLAQQAVEEERQEAEQKGVEVRTELPPHLPYLPLDGARVRRAIRALVAAALRRASEGTRVLVRVELREDEVWVEVEDSAPLSQRDAANAFDRQRQMLAHRKMVPGVSMALARAVAEGHGGRVEAYPTQTGGVHALILPYLRS
jgi:two-component system sensor histidine kinase MtrB